MKTSELSSDKLDYWVAKAQGWEKLYNDILGTIWAHNDELMERTCSYHPATNWQQCGELIEKFGVGLRPQTPKDHDDYIGGNHHATILRDKSKTYDYGIPPTVIFDQIGQYGSTPQEAICRAVVASVYGDTVEEE